MVEILFRIIIIKRFTLYSVPENMSENSKVVMMMQFCYARNKSEYKP